MNINNIDINFLDKVIEDSIFWVNIDALKMLSVLSIAQDLYRHNKIIDLDKHKDETID